MGLKSEAIIEKYSRLFEPVEVRSDMKKSCMFWGFECGDGWYDLIEKMLEELNALNEDIQIHQVKEKWGELTVYLSASSDEAYAIVDKYAAISVKTCEICGKPGTINSSGWISVRCEEHRKS